MTPAAANSTAAQMTSAGQEVVAAGPGLPWDGLQPWPRFPAALAATPLPALADSQGNGRWMRRRYIDGCDAVRLTQWPALRRVAQAVARALDEATQTLDHDHGDQQQTPGCTPATDSHPSPVQPWAKTGQLDPAPPVMSPQGYRPESISLSGRLVRGRSTAAAPSNIPTSPAPTPLHVVTTRAPLHRFIQCDAEKLAASDQPAAGGGMYHVRDPEWRTAAWGPTGDLPQLRACMGSWANTRILAHLPLATLHATTDEPSTSGAGQLECTREWVVSADATWPGLPYSGGLTGGHDSEADGCSLRAALQELAAWLPATLAADPLAAVRQAIQQTPNNQVSPTRLPPWSSAQLRVRWWSHSSMEPLRLHAADRLLLQITGTTRVLLIPPRFSLHLAPLPASHPYGGYSAPGIAATARPPFRPACQDEGPSSAHAMEEAEACAAVAQLWPLWEVVRGMGGVLAPGDALWVPAGWAVHMESVFPAEDGEIMEQQLPGNAVLEIALASTEAGAAPRALGALRVQAANVIEGWAAQATGNAARVRPLVLDLADRLQECASSSSGTPNPSITPRPDPPVCDPWVSFGSGAGPSPGDSLSAPPRYHHWALVSDQDGPSASSRAARWQPNWDPASLQGSDLLTFARRTLTLLAPLLALSDSLEGRPESDDRTPVTRDGRSLAVLPLESGVCWPAGAAAATFLRSMCAGRLLPTTWLNRLLNNDPLVLGDVPYRYALEFKDEDEVEFAELFAPQLAAREQASRDAARQRHYSRLRLTGSKGGTGLLMSPVSEEKDIVGAPMVS